MSATSPTRSAAAMVFTAGSIAGRAIAAWPRSGGATQCRPGSTSSPAWSTRSSATTSAGG
eukprot:1870329-Alexandrium_andersonii.AAC.1